MCYTFTQCGREYYASHKMPVRKAQVCTHRVSTQLPFPCDCVSSIMQWLSGDLCGFNPGTSWWWDDHPATWTAASVSVIVCQCQHKKECLSSVWSEVTRWVVDVEVLFVSSANIQTPTTWTICVLHRHMDTTVTAESSIVSFTGFHQTQTRENTRTIMQIS